MPNLQGTGAGAGAVLNAMSLYSAEANGILPDGNDHTAELNALLANIYALGGGEIRFGLGTFRFDKQIVFPNDGTLYTGGTQIGAKQPSFAIVGTSPGYVLEQVPPVNTGGTILELRYVPPAAFTGKSYNATTHVLTTSDNGNYVYHPYDIVQITGGTGVQTGYYLITAADATTITIDPTELVSGNPLAASNKTDVAGQIFTGGRIATYGFGKLEVANITFQSAGSGTGPMLYSTATTLYVHDCGFLGRQGYSPTGPVYPLEDAIWLGSGYVATDLAQRSPPYANGASNAFGTVITRNVFDAIKRCVRANFCGDGLTVVDNLVWARCGGTYAASSTTDGAAFESLGTSAEGCQNAFSSISRNWIEMYGYKYGIAVDYSNRITLIGNNFPDFGAIATAGIYLGSHSRGNFVVAGYGTPYLVDNSTATNYYSTYVGQADVRDTPSTFASDLPTWDGEAPTIYRGPVSFRKNDKDAYRFETAAGWGPVIKNLTSGQEWHQQVDQSNGRLKQLVNWTGVGDVEVMALDWQGGGTFKWRFGATATLGYVYNPSGHLFLQCPNGSAIVIASNTTGEQVGFFGSAGTTRAANVADTSGATLGQLETTVNALKAILRGYNLMG